MDYRTFALGVVTGVSISSAIRLLRPKAGVLRIDRTDPQKEIYRFEVDNLEALSKKKHIVLKVDNYADLSQK